MSTNERGKMNVNQVSSGIYTSSASEDITMNVYNKFLVVTFMVSLTPDMVQVLLPLHLNEIMLCS